MGYFYFFGNFTLAALTGDGSVIVSGIGLVECCVIFLSVVRVYGIIVVLVSVWYTCIAVVNLSVVALSRIYGV